VLQAGSPISRSRPGGARGLGLLVTKIHEESMRIYVKSKVICGLLVAIASPVAPVLAANYPLELTNIKPAGSPGLDANNRIYRAYPGLEYYIRAAVIGGAYPFTYSLSNAPAGMTVNGFGVISWPNPSGNANPTLTVRDAEGTQVSATWTINVTTAGFKFIDGVNGRNAANNGCSSACGDGTVGNPWRTMSDAYRNTATTDITYWRRGTYQQLDLTPSGTGGWERIDWGTSGRTRIFLAYPGETPVIDFGYNASTRPTPPGLRIGGCNVYFDGFETRNSKGWAFQPMTTAGCGFTFIRMNMHSHGPGINGQNSAFISASVAAFPHGVGSVIMGSSFSNGTGSTSVFQTYTQNKMLVADNIISGAPDGWQVKGDHERWEFRNNRVSGMSHQGLGGNMNTANDGEVRFNYIVSSESTVVLNNDGVAGRAYVYRNTLVGRVAVLNTDGADGPFSISNNVIINSDPGNHVFLSGVDASRVTITNNLAGSSSDNIVDSNGLLTGSYAAYVGSRGYQVGTGSSLPVPAPPTSVRVIR
jgi:hypothetical protein